MTEDQGKVLTAYDWTSVGILAFLVLIFLCINRFGVLRAFSGSYTPRGEDMKVLFVDLSLPGFLGISYLGIT
jgi:hypothetical protein